MSAEHIQLPMERIEGTQKIDCNYLCFQENVDILYQCEKKSLLIEILKASIETLFVFLKRLVLQTICAVLNR